MMIKPLNTSRNKFRWNLQPLVKSGNSERKTQLFPVKRNVVEELYIKNMVCIRCKMFVKATLYILGLDYSTIALGKIVITSYISSNQRDQLRIALLKGGLELLDDKKDILVEKITIIIIQMVHYSDDLPETNYSDYISRKLNLDYKYLSNVFSSVKGISIQKFIISHKIEKVKELLSYDELTLSEISYKLHYSSVAHLSSQFKKVTGICPSYFLEKSFRKELCLV